MRNSYVAEPLLHYFEEQEELLLYTVTKITLDYNKCHPI
jgi:hypothetical protein